MCLDHAYIDDELLDRGSVWRSFVAFFDHAAACILSIIDPMAAAAASSAQLLAASLKASVPPHSLCILQHPSLFFCTVPFASPANGPDAPPQSAASRVDAAAASAGRCVRLVAVSKLKPAADVQATPSSAPI